MNQTQRNSETISLPWFVDVLKRVENQNKKGYDGQLWFPHKSVEGGNDTIGYGHKILSDKVMIDGTEYNLSTDGLSEDVVHKLLLQDIALAERKARIEFTKHQPMGATKWNDLHIGYKTILTELVFNIGTLEDKRGSWGWPSLIKGMKADDLATIKKEMARTFVDSKGVQQPLKTRVNTVWAEVKNSLQARPTPRATNGAEVLAFLRETTNPQYFDKLPASAKAKLVLRILQRNNQQVLEESKQQEGHSILIQEAYKRDEQESELLRRKEAEAQLQDEVGQEIDKRDKELETLRARVAELEAQPVQPKEDTVVGTEPLADVQYFMDDSGKVIKVDSKGNRLDD